MAVTATLKNSSFPPVFLCVVSSLRFHLDEVLATVMLLKLPEYKDARILRSRDPEVLATCDVVVDVGAVYDAEKRRFDHHQKGFVHTFYDEGNPEEETAHGAGTTNGHHEQGGQGNLRNKSCGDDLQETRKRKRPRTPVTKLSSAGLIYKHFGRELLKQPQYGKSSRDGAA